MPEKSNGCFEDGGYRVEVKVISQERTSQFDHQVDDVVVFYVFRATPSSPDRWRCSRITTKAKAIQMRTRATFRTKND